MRIVFMGTANFALTILKKLVDRKHEIIAVYTQPPRPSGRGKKIKTGPVGSFAGESGIRIISPKDFSHENDLRVFKALKADIVIVAEYGLILPIDLLELSKFGFFNVHASLLPRWRGAAPIQRAILAGDEETGISLIKMDAKLDSGPLVLKKSIKIHPTDTSGNLSLKLSELGGALTLELLDNLDNLNFEIQPAIGISYAKKIEKSETKINWNESAEFVKKQVRAFSPHPGAWFELNGERIKLLKCSIIKENRVARSIGFKPFNIACKFGVIRPILLQRAGKTPVAAKDFLNGFMIPAGENVS